MPFTRELIRLLTRKVGISHLLRNLQPTAHVFDEVNITADALSRVESIPPINAY